MSTYIFYKRKKYRKDEDLIFEFSFTGSQATLKYLVNRNMLEEDYIIVENKK